MVWSAEKWSPLVTPPRTPYRNLGLMDIPPHTSQLTYRLQSSPLGRQCSREEVWSKLVNIQLVTVECGGGGGEWHNVVIWDTETVSVQQIYYASCQSAFLLQPNINLAVILEPCLITSHDLGSHLHDSFSGEILLSQWRGGVGEGEGEGGGRRGDLVAAMLCQCFPLQCWLCQ